MTHRETLIAYLLMKVEEGDFHAVADAAMDLRELDAEARGAENARLLNAKSGEALRAIASGEPHVHRYDYDAPRDTYVCACGHHRLG